MKTDERVLYSDTMEFHAAVKTNELSTNIPNDPMESQEIVMGGGRSQTAAPKEIIHGSVYMEF